jgi:hypothetical protein
MVLDAPYSPLLIKSLRHDSHHYQQHHEDLNQPAVLRNVALDVMATSKVQDAAKYLKIVIKPKKYKFQVHDLQWFVTLHSCIFITSV